MIRIGDLDLGVAPYRAQLALQEKLKVTNENFKEFDKDYDKHFYNEYGINITYQYPAQVDKWGHNMPRGAMTYEFASDKDLAWFLLKWDY